MRKFILLLLILPLTLLARPEKKWLQIPTASLFGSVRWVQTTNCAGWYIQTTSWTDLATDADCDDNARDIEGFYNSTNGEAGNSDGQKFQIKFSKMPVGHYLFTFQAARTYKNAAAGGHCYARFDNGTLQTSFTSWGDTGTSEDQQGIYSGWVNITKELTDTTWTVQFAGNTASFTCGLVVNETIGEASIAVYYYPHFKDARYIITK